MRSQISPWKTAAALVLYVVLCLLVLIFSPPDYAGHDGLIQTGAPLGPAATSTAKPEST